MTTSVTLQTDPNGAYTFPDVPFGNRSLVVEPRLVYVQDTAVTTGGQDNDVEFLVQNYSSDTVSFSSITIVHDVTAFYENLRIGNTTVFSSSSDRVASGEVVAFTAEDVPGTGSIAGSTLPIRLQAMFTLNPNQDIGEAAEKGGSVRVQMQNFKDAETGSGSNVDMTGISFEVTFSDGSVAIFTTVRQ